MKGNHDKINGFLGERTNFEGSLSFSGTVRIDGHFKGKISSDGKLIVGESAVIESDISVSNLVVSGEIRGTIISKDRIEIYTTGKVFGDIFAPTIVVNEGAVFEGQCQMQKDSRESEKVTQLSS